MRAVAIICLTVVVIVTANATPNLSNLSPRSAQEDWIRPGESIPENLPEIAARQGVDPGYFDVNWFNRTSVTPLQVLGRSYGVLVQRYLGAGMSAGNEVRQVVLVTPKGRILDRLRCGISNRYGDLEVEVHERPTDGAHIVIRFVPVVYPWEEKPASLWHNYHEIIYHHKLYRFSVASPVDPLTPTEWNEKGLCRLRVENDKFVVLFPKLEHPEREPPEEVPISVVVEPRPARGQRQ
jgi:hypothetical protein